MTKRELMAIVVYTKKWKHFLVGSDFIKTNHHSLHWLLNFKEVEGMMGRWLATLSEYAVTNEHIGYRKGVQHVNADSLSRIRIWKCGRKDCSDCDTHV